MEDMDEYYGKKMSCGVSETILTPEERLELENLSHGELVSRVLAAREMAKWTKQEVVRMNEAIELQEKLKLARRELRATIASLPRDQVERIWGVIREVYHAQLIGRSLELEIDALRRLAGLDPPKK